MPSRPAIALFGQSFGEQLEHLDFAGRQRLDVNGGDSCDAGNLVVVPVRMVRGQEHRDIARLAARASASVANSPTTSIEPSSCDRMRSRSRAAPTRITRIIHVRNVSDLCSVTSPGARRP